MKKSSQNFIILLINILKSFIISNGIKINVSNVKKNTDFNKNLKLSLWNDSGIYQDQNMENELNMICLLNLSFNKQSNFKFNRKEMLFNYLF